MASAEEIPQEQEPTKGELVETMRGMQARMDRLEEENESLRAELAEVRRSSLTESAMNQLLAALVGSEHVDFSADPFENREVLEDIRDRLEAVERQTAQFEELEDRLSDGATEGVSEAWEAIVEQARNKQHSSNHGLPNNRVKLHRDDIVGATGKSEDMCGTYIEWFAGDPENDNPDHGKYHKRGTEFRPYRPPSDGVAQRRKAIIVDLDVWGADE